MNRVCCWVLASLASSLVSCVGNLGGEGGDAAPVPAVDGASCEASKVGAPVLRRLSGVELDHSLRDIFPEIEAAWSGVRLGPDPASKLGFTNDAESLQVGEQTAKELLATAEDVAELVTAADTLPAILPCAASQPGPACAAELVTRYGLRLFRRPVSDEEKAELLSLFASVSGKSDFRRGVKWTLVAMIQSPHAVYRSELGAPKDGRYELSQYEVATELAYNFGGTTPTRELLDKAAQGALDSDEALVEEARSLLDTPRGRETLHRFLQQWTGYERVRGQAKVSVQDFARTGDLMIEETRRFLEEVVYNRDAGVRELLTAPYTFVNAELSQFYGFGGVSGDFQRVDRPADWGVGLLAQGSMLAGNASMDSSSPTRRGLVVYRRLLCGDVPPPPDKIPPVERPNPGVSTTRARYETVHTASPGCKVCHDNFDPSGFASEHFDETGRYRADEGGLAIDDSGYIAAPGGKTPVQGEKGLSEALASDPATTACVSKLAAVYAYGGATGASCAIDGLQQRLASEEYGLLGYFARLSATEHARYRVRRE
jgi:hypothetical protein